VTRLGRLAEEIGFVVKAARPGFWLTSIWFYLVPAGGRNVFHQPEFWLGLLYVTFPLGLLIYGWNDIVDFEVDRFNPRKGTYLFGARGTPERLARLPWRIGVVQVPFAVLFTLILGPRALAWFAALIVAAALYNARPFAFKGGSPSCSVPCSRCTPTCSGKSWTWSPIDAPAVGPWPACWEHGRQSGCWSRFSPSKLR